jgi:Holliday junction resolvase
MGPEAKFYQKLKRNFKSISLIRIENSSLHGTPDLLGYNNSGHFFTLELKVTRSNKIRFSPHQIAFHIEHLGSGTVKLFRGSRIMELEACGFKLEACCLGLDACRLELEACGL